MTYSKTLNDIEGHTPWTQAEERLIAECPMGPVVFGNTRPDTRTSANTIRPALIRHLATQGCDIPLGHYGLLIRGAWIDGDLDLMGLHNDIHLAVIHTHVAGQIKLADAKLSLVSFEGTLCHGLEAQRVKLSQSLFLRNGFHAKGAVNLHSAYINGQLSFSGSTFENALSCQSVFVEDGWFFRKLEQAPTRLDITRMHVGEVFDDAPAWRQTGAFDLEGFKFDHISSNIPTAQRLRIWGQKTERPFKRYYRLSWHADSVIYDFDPTPFSNLARYYDNSGHHTSASDVRAERDWRMAQAAYHRYLCALDGSFIAAFRELWATLGFGMAWLFKITLAHGHKPARSLRWLFVLWVIGAGIFGATYHRDQLVPAPAPVLMSADWARSIAANPDNPVVHWKEHSDIGKDYETFNAPLYAADVIIPLINFGQEDAWSSTTTRGGWGVFAFYAKPTLKTLGWLLTAIAAAAVTGVIGRKD